MTAPAATPPASGQVVIYLAGGGSVTFTTTAALAAGIVERFRSTGWLCNAISEHHARTFISPDGLTVVRADRVAAVSWSAVAGKS